MVMLRHREPALGKGFGHTFDAVIHGAAMAHGDGPEGEQPGVSGTNSHAETSIPPSAWKRHRSFTRHRDFLLSINGQPSRPASGPGHFGVSRLEAALHRGPEVALGLRVVHALAEGIGIATEVLGWRARDRIDPVPRDQRQQHARSHLAETMMSATGGGSSPAGPARSLKRPTDRHDLPVGRRGTRRRSFSQKTTTCLRTTSSIGILLIAGSVRLRQEKPFRSEARRAPPEEKGGGDRVGVNPKIETGS